MIEQEKTLFGRTWYWVWHPGHKRARGFRCNEHAMIYDAIVNPDDGCECYLSNEETRSSK